MKFGPAAFYKKALGIALPMMAQLLIQNLVSLIDNFMVAGLGDVKMSGVNIAGQINFMFIALLFNVLCPAAGIFMSQFCGAGDDNGMKSAFRLKIIACVCAAAAWAALSGWRAESVLSLMAIGNSDASSIISEAVKYQRALAPSWLPAAVSAAIASSLRETGETRAPLVISVAATLVNTCANYALIYGNLGCPRMEVRGAAIATVIARSAEMCAFVIYAAREKPRFAAGVFGAFKIDRRLSLDVARKAAMIAVSELTWAASETITMAIYNSRGGAEIVSGMASGFSIANLFCVCFSGIYTTTGVLVGSALGAGRLDDARRQKEWIEGGSLAFGFFFAAMGFLSQLLIPVVFSSLSAEARSVSRALVVCAAAYMPLWCVVNAQFAVSRAGGDTMMGALIDLSANALLMLPAIFILARFTTLGPVAMYALVKLSDVYKLIFASIWLGKEKWLRNIAAEMR